MSQVMETVPTANLAMGRAIRKLKLHDKACAQCQAATDANDRCDAVFEILQDIADYKDDASAAAGGIREQS